MPTSQKLRPDQDNSTAERLSVAEQAAQDQLDAGKRDKNNPTDSRQEDAAEKLSQSEQAAFDQLEESYKNKDDYSTDSPWDTDIKGRNNQFAGVGRFNRALSFIGRRKGITGTVLTVLLGGGVLAGVFGPATMLINLTQNLTIGNDSSSVAMERRFAKVFQNAVGGDGLCQGSIKCKHGKISNSALRGLSAKGITPILDGVELKPGRTGYPSRNPTHYEIDGPNNTRVRLTAANLTDELLRDRRLASKVLGTGGAINLRVRAWTGKHISQRLFSKVPGLVKNGGTASNEHKGKPKAERKKALSAKMATNNRLVGSVTGAKLSEKTRGNLNRARKGGPAYLTSVAGCIIVKAPKYIAGAIVGVQLLQILPIVTDFVMSPGDKNMAAGFGSGFDPADADVASILTDRYPDKNGELKSALDSPILLAALGVNTNKVDLSRAPGFAAMNHPLVRAGRVADEAAEPSCNVIMSPAAMYSAMAADIAVTLGASLTIIGGIVKIAGSFVIAHIVTELVSRLLAEGLEAVVRDLAENDEIPEAQGIDLGDYIGFSAMALFSSGGMARHLPTLKESQLDSFEAMRKENEQFQKEMDIASLSPFDTSSRHTFMGSIIHTMSMTMLRNGTHSNNASSILSNIVRLPAMALSYGAHVDAATNISATYCGYAKDFGLEASNPQNTPAINAAGLPCTGITPEQDTMSTIEAIDLLIGEGWLEDTEPPEGATISDLIDSGIIVEDTPLIDFIETCGDATSGDYLFNSAGCTVGGSGDIAGGINNIPIDCFELDDGSRVCASDSEDFTGEDLPPLVNSRSLLAISVFLLDYQLIQSINGEDEGVAEAENGGQTPPESDPIEGLPAPVGNYVSPIPPDAQGSIRTSARYGRYPSGGPHWGIDLTGRGDNGWEFVSVCDGVVDRVAINSTFANANARGVSGSTNYVWIKCDNGVSMGYAHFYANRLRSYISPGYRISAGTPIAPQGNQGNSTGAHLHFQINPYGPGYSAAATVDPATYLQGLGISLPRANY